MEKKTMNSETLLNELTNKCNSIVKNGKSQDHYLELCFDNIEIYREMDILSKNNIEINWVTDILSKNNIEIYRELDILSKN